MLGRDVKEGNAQNAVIQKFLWVMMPKEEYKFGHRVTQIPMHTHRDSCHLTLPQTVLFDLTLTILVPKALLNVARTHITIATCWISDGQTLKYN